MRQWQHFADGPRLPLPGTISRFYDALSRWGDPAIKLLLRWWIGALFSDRAS